MNGDFLIPKYFQIASEIITNIKANKLNPGDKIPSENDIIKQYQVSNTTARKVLFEIEKEGWVVRVKGKGTYVKENPIDRNATKILSFTKNMKQMGLVPATKLISSMLIHKPIIKTISQRKYSMQPPVYKITRLRFANNIPVMKEDRYISMIYCPGIDEINMEQPLYDIYKDIYGLQIQQIDQVLSAIIINKELCRLFNASKKIPGFMVEGVTFCGNEMILEMEESIYRGDKYKFTVQATP